MYNSYASVLAGATTYRYYVVRSTMRRQIRYGNITYEYHQHVRKLCCCCYSSSYNMILDTPLHYYNQRNFVTITNSNNNNDTNNMKTIGTSDDATEMTMTKPTPTETTSTSNTKKNKRQRHQFHNHNHKSFDLKNIPSYHDFQRQIQIRTLYRNYTKLIGLYSKNKKNTNTNANHNNHSNNSTSVPVVVLSHSQKLELQQQVRQEFRYQKSTNHQNDVHYIQMAYSEGQRRYKELYNMIHNTPSTTTSNNNNNIVSSTNINTPETTISNASTIGRPPNATDHVWPWNQPKQQNDKEIESLDTAYSSSGTTTTTTHEHEPTTSILNQSSMLHPMKFPPKSNLK
jgi:hypothetical protein